MADNVCPYCGFPNEAGVKVCKKCKKPYSFADSSHVITNDISFTTDKETLVEKTDIVFSDEEDVSKEKKANIRFDLEEEIDKPTQPIDSNRSISRQFYAATFLQRLGSLLIDTIIVLVCILIIWFAGISFSINPNQIFNSKEVNAKDIILSLLMLYVLFGFFYSTLFHHLSSRTLGKMLFGLHLVGKKSYRVSIYRILLRNFLFILNIFTLFIGFIWIIADEKGQALHDKLSDTFVVSEEIK